MVKRFIIAFFEPRTWLLSAALCLLGWAGVGYHLDQISAAVVLGETAGSSDPSALALVRQSLGLTALFMGLVAGVLALPIWPQDKRRSNEERIAASRRSDTSGAFQPIRTQEELGKDEKDEKPVPRKTLSRLASSALFGRRTSKNQP